MPALRITLRYRGYESGDETQIVRLYRSVFGTSYDATRWRWQYRDNPASRRPQICMAFSGATLVGHTAAVPRKLSGNGGDLDGARTQDSFVHPDFRRQGVYTELLRQLDSCHRDGSVGLTLSYPNRRSSFVAMTGSGLYEHLFDIWPYTVDLGALAGRPASGPTVTLSGPAGFTAADSELLTRELSRYEIHGTREVDWLRWRYHQNSGKTYRVARVFDGAAQVGLVVFKAFRRGGSVDLVELALPEDELPIRATLAAISESARQEGLSTMSLWSMEHYALHHSLLEIGFSRRGQPTHVIGQARPPADSLAWREPATHYLSMGESDIY